MQPNKNNMSENYKKHNKKTNSRFAKSKSTSDKHSSNNLKRKPANDLKKYETKPHIKKQSSLKAQGLINILQTVEFALVVRQIHLLRLA